MGGEGNKTFLAHNKKRKGKMGKKLNAVKEINAVDGEVLARENQLLREKILVLEQSREASNLVGGSLANEMRKIREKGKSSANSLEVTLQCDHKNITLWTKWGKPVGPTHPDNAIQALNSFANVMGIVLSVDKPTPEQVEAYNNSIEGQKRIKFEQERRARKQKSLKTGQLEKYTAEIAKQTGLTVVALNNILKPSEVGKK